MTYPAHQLNQVEELTRGLALPLPPLSQTHLLVILERITAAWAELATSQRSILTSGSEPEINALLETALSRMLLTDQLWGQLVSAIARGKESVSYDGSHLEKRPDLSIFLTRNNPSFPLVVECKIVDAGSSKTLALYCSKGIKRFVDGEYAWASQEAFIVGYVRDRSAVSSHLAAHLAAKMSHANDDLNTLAPYANFRPLEYSRHGRAFAYPANCGITGPGEISIYHLWLQC